MSRRTIGAVVLLGGLAPLPAWCQNTCSISSTALAFGSYTGSAAVASTATVTASCAGLIVLGINYTISLGSGGSGSITARSMAGGAIRLGYQIYTNVGHTTVWGDGTAGTSTQTGSFALNLFNPTANFTAYGLIPTGLEVYGGSYTDSVLITITY